MSTSHRIGLTSPRLSRLAGAAAILFVPLAVLLVVLLIRADDLVQHTTVRLGALDLSVDAQTAVRVVVSAGLLAAAAVVAGTLLRSR